MSANLARYGILPSSLLVRFDRAFDEPVVFTISDSTKRLVFYFENTGQINNCTDPKTTARVLVNWLLELFKQLA